MKPSYQITEWCKRVMAEHIPEGGLCIDATMGNGSDTLFLCEKVGEKGKVLAFDIQQEALEHTRERLKKQLPWENYALYLESHSEMYRYAAEATADVITFNLGYLPSGDHQIATKAETTLEALGQGLKLLKVGGLMSVCIYSGGDSGYEERDAVLDFLKDLDSRNYLVLLTRYYNRPNNPPIPAFIIRLK